MSALSGLATSVRFARRELRSGLQGFRIFLACLALGVAAIAIVGSLAASIERGISEQGQPLLGGDVEFSIIHRSLSDKERAFLDSAGEVSRVATLRAMASAGTNHALVEAKAVDGAYPLYGALEIEGGGTVTPALARRDGVWGALAEAPLLPRLGVKVGDRLKLGTAEFELRGVIAREPDRVTDGFILGPRMMISGEALAATGLIRPGSLVTWRHRVRLEGDRSAFAIKALLAEAKQRFPDAGWRTRSRDNAAPQVEQFLERLEFFLVLVGLTALIVGGVGVANAVQAFLERRRRNIAILKCLGAPSAFIFRTYLVEVLMVAMLAIAAGLIAGAMAPALATAFLADLLPVPVVPEVEPLPLLRAGLFGILVTLAFGIWPLARAGSIQAAALFRDAVQRARRLPPARYIAASALALLLLAGLALWSFPERSITLWYLGGLAAGFVVLSGLAALLMRVAQGVKLPLGAVARLALSNLHRPGSPTPSVVLSLGLGLSLFVTLALIDRNISAELRSNLPERAPSFFFLDVNSAELDEFTAKIREFAGVKTVEAAPMLRGRLTEVKGVASDKAKSAPESQWALRGDRGLTYSDTLPAGSSLVQGAWWPANYTGEPLVSFSDDIAKGLGLSLGDTVKVNVLGREVTARLSNTRAVDWRSLQMNFVMVFSPNTLKGAPHMALVTVSMDADKEAALLEAVSQAFPTVTAVRVKEALDTVNDIMGNLIAAVRGANAVTLAIGILVLAGALATGLSRRTYDAVVLKTYGATRRQLLSAFLLEYSVLGLVAAAFAVLAGSAAAYAIIHYVMELPWNFSLAVAAGTALIAMIATAVSGLLTTWSALAAKPARLLRDE